MSNEFTVVKRDVDIERGSKRVRTGLLATLDKLDTGDAIVRRFTFKADANKLRATVISSVKSRDYNVKSAVYEDNG